MRKPFFVFRCAAEETMAKTFAARANATTARAYVERSAWGAPKFTVRAFARRWLLGQSRWAKGLLVLWPAGPAGPAGPVPQKF